MPILENNTKSDMQPMSLLKRENVISDSGAVGVQSTVSKVYEESWRISERQTSEATAERSH